ncbi:ParB N-terminal domain-containing protein [Streptomyces jumonjinensis]|uniref:ParB-like N-terminal domain-containing protein n=1 Tax=Streptomyces jumonjinensis TaxID=1945 RepID=A0A646KDB5_STRJU|nr:ParB/RepB/Spo0J family partition protein [Streptomyces jumonjinensis]MQT00110.1 hypothetical protein [Streptomyces jumonjinensis]
MSFPMADPDRRDFLTSREAIGHVQLPAWPRSNKSLRLVELDVEWVRFSTLNHRTKAEQQREAQRQGQDDLFSSDPLGPTAQEVQLAILAGQQKFDELKEDLRKRDQQEPAIVTADGVLINGNRRTAALRMLLREGHLKCQYVRCLVLPGDATPEEILLLEAELQVARDFREDYSWINEAMMIEELYELSDRDWEQVSVRMHRPRREVQGLYEKLLLVQQLVNQSQGARLPIDFTDNESAFDELAKHIRTLPATEAAGVKNAYFLGIVSGVNYRQLRHLRREDSEALVAKELRSEATLEGLVAAASTGWLDDVENDPLSDLLGDDEPQDTVVEDILGLIVTRRPEAVVELADGSGVPMQSVLRSLSGAVSAAAQEADERSREQNTVDAPFQRTEKALRELNRLPALLRSSRAHSGWDEDAFQDELDRMEKLLAQLRESS